jgi:excinuclease ABC subunit C
VEGLTTPPDYRQAVRDAQMFLEGRQTELSRSLEERMEQAASSEQFEVAARYRDLLITLNQVQERQRMATTDGDDADVYGYHHENGMLAVNLFHMRGGKIVDRREFFWEDLPESPPGAGGHAGTAVLRGCLRSLLLFLCAAEAVVHRPAVCAADGLHPG